MAELKQSEKLELIRKGVMSVIAIPENATKVGTATFIVETENGYGKVTVSAIKDPDFDPKEAQAEYEFEREEAENAATDRKEKAEAKKAADIKRKAELKAKNA